MTLLGGILMLSTLRLHGIAAYVGDNVHFTSSKKPLECHEKITVGARSALECSLQCLNNLYSCAGYVFGKMENSTFHCDACFIYDVTTPLVKVQATNNTITRMLRIDVGSGKILGLNLLSGKTSYRQISWYLEAARLGVIMFVSLCNLNGISATPCFSNLRAIEKIYTQISVCGHSQFRSGSYSNSQLPVYW